MGDVPTSDAPWDAVARYAMTYDADDRWYGDHGTVVEMVAPLPNGIDEQRAVLRAPGVDDLRAWLFALIRSEHFITGIAPAVEGSFSTTSPSEDGALRAIITALHQRDERGQNQ
jgi:hypothetical protein